MKQLLSIILILSTSLSYAQPPYSGTIFFDPDIIKPSDPSAIKSTTYTGRGSVTMYDRRASNWVSVNAYLFDVVWNDGLTSRAQVNPEFGSISAATVEAEKYAFLIGQLPYCLRTDVNEIWIHKGTKPFGGGNNSILIHTGQTTNYENNGILEETLVHEACHTSLDAAHASSDGWKNAQNLDNEFISTYARDNPTREDIAETFLTWLAVRYRKDEISTTDFNKITQAIPNRLAYFDGLELNLSPFETTVGVRPIKSGKLKIYPNPASEYVRFTTNDIIDLNKLTIYNLSGQNVNHLITTQNGQINIENLFPGFYILKQDRLAISFVKR